MLNYIKANYRAGDSIEITSSEGVFTGNIEYVTDKFIILRQPNGQICGIAAANITSFTAQAPAWQAPDHVPTTLLPLSENDTEPEENEMEDEEAPLDSDNETPVDNSLINESLAAVSEPKVVGHIDLDKLQRIDPRFNRKRYFRNEENAIDDDTEDYTNDTTVNNGKRAPYVTAKGRITYYNSERRYGFIHDYETENSLYFHMQQVADPRLFDELHKGTKVAYSIDRNTQGFVARCVHLPQSFTDLINLAEDQYDSRHYNVARDLVQHILDVDPEYKPARDLKDEMAQTAQPQRYGNYYQQPTQYAPNTLYAQAKRAYLNKNFEEAESLYKQAIEAGEKVETCIKDLVTQYVSDYKQQTDPELKKQAKQKAVDFLNSHRDLLPDTLTNKQFLALNYYLPLLDLNKFIELVDEIMADQQVAAVTSRRVFYIWQKAIAYNKLGFIDDALDLIEEGLTLAPYNRQLTNLKNQILNPEYVQPGTDSLVNDAPVSASAEAEYANENADETEKPSTSATDNAEAADDEAAATDDSTGIAKPDSWWEELKNPQ